MASFKQQDVWGDRDQINEVKEMSQRQGWEASPADVARLSLPHPEGPLHPEDRPAGWLGQVPAASASIRGGELPKADQGAVTRTRVSWTGKTTDVCYLSCAQRFL